MTGSGKTGLCVSLLEEAAIDGIPAIVIDPKGDLGNLALALPEPAAGGLRALDRPGEAARKGSRPPSSPRAPPRAGARASPSGARTASASRACATPEEMAIYTPGQHGGPARCRSSVVRAPPQSVLDDDELCASASPGRVTGLLGLSACRGRSAAEPRARAARHDPRGLGAGRAIDLRGTRGARAEAPFIERVGVLDLETFFPPRIASRSRWRSTTCSRRRLRGMDLGRAARRAAAAVHEGEGKPRISIVSIAHLGDASACSS
jgi:hypothetical protein